MPSGTEPLFALDERLRLDTLCVGHTALSVILLMNDARYPWLILVPQRPDIAEIHHLTAPDQALLWQESAVLARTLEQVYSPDKLNIAAIGNRVRQLHIHHVARYVSDAVWPNPVWGLGQSTPYAEQKAERTIQRLQSALAVQFARAQLYFTNENHLQ